MSNTNNTIINQNNVATENGMRFFNVRAIAKYFKVDMDMMDITNKSDFIIRVDDNNRYSSTFINAELFVSYALALRLLKASVKSSDISVKTVLANLIDFEMGNQILQANEVRANGTVKAKKQATEIMNNIKVSIPKRKGLTVKKTVLEKLVDSKGAL